MRKVISLGMVFFWLGAVFFIIEGKEVKYSKVKKIESERKVVKGKKGKEEVTKRNKKEIKAKEKVKKRVIFSVPAKDRERIEYIKETLKYGTPKEILIALYRKDFILRYYTSFVPLLISVYQERDEVEVQSKIVEVLSYIWDKDEESRKLFNICDVLSIGKDKKIKDISPRIKRKLAFLIGKYKCKDKLWILERIIESEGIKINNNLVLTAINSIAKLGTKEGGRFLATLLKDKGDYMDKTIKANIILAIGKCNYREAISVIANIFKDVNEDVYVRAYSANAIGTLLGKEYKSLLEAELSRINQKGIYERERLKVLYFHILYALMKLGEQDVKKYLLKAIRSTNPKIRALSIHLLGELKDTSCRDILLYRAKYDENISVRLAAIESLGNICPPNILKPLNNLLVRVRSIRLKNAIKEAIKRCSKKE